LSSVKLDASHPFGTERTGTPHAIGGVLIFRLRRNEAASFPRPEEARMNGSFVLDKVERRRAVGLDRLLEPRFRCQLPKILAMNPYRIHARTGSSDKLGRMSGKPKVGSEPSLHKSRKSHMLEKTISCPTEMCFNCAWGDESLQGWIARSVRE
jgi:hypothetical protein